MLQSEIDKKKEDGDEENGVTVVQGDTGLEKSSSSASPSRRKEAGGSFKANDRDEILAKKQGDSDAESLKFKKLAASMDLVNRPKKKEKDENEGGMEETQAVVKDDDDDDDDEFAEVEIQFEKDEANE